MQYGERIVLRIQLFDWMTWNHLARTVCSNPPLCRQYQKSALQTSLLPPPLAAGICYSIVFIIIIQNLPTCISYACTVVHTLHRLFARVLHYPPWCAKIHTIQIECLSCLYFLGLTAVSTSVTCFSVCPSDILCISRIFALPVGSGEDYLKRKRDNPGCSNQDGWTN